VYTAVARSCAGREYGRLHDPYTAVYGLCTCVHCRVHYRLCTVVHGPCTRPCIIRPVYTTVYMAHTRPLDGCVRAVNTAVYTSMCTWPCRVYTAVQRTRKHDRVHAVYTVTAVYGM